MEKTDGPIMSVEDALILLDVMPVVVGFDDDEPLLERYQAAVKVLRDEVSHNRNLMKQINHLKAEVFSWRICWAIWWVFIIALGLIGFFAK